MSEAPKKFRDREPTDHVENADVLPLSRMAGGTAKTYSITWEHMSAQIMQAMASGLSDKMRLSYNGAVVESSRMLFVKKALTTAGTLVIYLTSDGTLTGTALFATSVLNVQPVVSDASTVYAFAWVISPDRKTLTLTVSKSATPVLSLLSINILAAPTAAPVGTSVQVLVIGY